jgi:predicted RNA polymerase sigma factor
MDHEDLLPNLFRTEYRKIISVLYKRFGFDQMEVAEDIASETFLTAAQVWGLDALPENPTAWLYAVAKNKAKNHLNRRRILQKKVIPNWSFASNPLRFRNRRNCECLFNKQRNDE